LDGASVGSMVGAPVVGAWHATLVRALRAANKEAPSGPSAAALLQLNTINSIVNGGRVSATPVAPHDFKANKKLSTMDLSMLGGDMVPPRPLLMFLKEKLEKLPTTVAYVDLPTLARAHWDRFVVCSFLLIVVLRYCLSV
jgi:hypothetical protein